MREIKFRAWREDDRTMYDDVTFDKVEVSWFNPTAKQDPDDPEPGCRVLIGDREENSLLPHVILMQFTGLKDKNGKEIYEGDIIQGGIVYYTHKGDVGIVRFGKFDADSSGDEYPRTSCVGWYYEIIKSDYTIDYDGNFPGEDIEVIGNIYENSDLLKTSIP